MTDVPGDLEDLNDRIIRAAKGTIPRSKNRINGKMVAWWTEECQAAARNRIRTLEHTHLCVCGWVENLVHTSGHKGAVMHLWLYSTRP